VAGERSKLDLARAKSDAAKGWKQLKGDLKGDSDNDGLLSLAELLKVRDTLGAKEPTAENVAAASDFSFLNVDHRAPTAPKEEKKESIALENVAQPKSVDLTGNQSFEIIFANADANKDGKISAAEMVTMYIPITPTLNKALASARFKLADADKDNALSFTEYESLHPVPESVGTIEVEEDNKEDLKAQFEKQATSGKLSMDGFLVADYGDYDDLSKQVDTILSHDTNKDGAMSLEELTDNMHIYGHQFHQEEL